MHGAPLKAADLKAKSAADTTVQNKLQNSLQNTAQYTASFRLFLEAKLAERCQRNPKYSLRSFAQSLGVHHATLSHLIRGSRPLTERSIQNLGRKMNLSPFELNRYLEEFRRELKNKSKPPLLIRKNYFEPIEPETFEVVSEWYYDAILELTRLDDFKGDPAWIARRLKISTTQVTLALDKLISLKLLEILPDGRWLDKSEFNSTTSHILSSAAQRRYQREVLEMGMAAMDAAGKESRDNSSIMMAMNSADIPEVKKRIQDFRRKLCAFLQRKEIKADCVYQLGMAFYPISTPASESKDSIAKSRKDVDENQTW